MSPSVTVIITHHLDENKEYLDWAIESVLRSQGVSFELIVVSDAPTCPEVPDGVTLIWDRALSNACKKAIHAARLSHPEARNLCFISDDVVVSEDCLYHLNAAASNATAIVGPASNSDIPGRYWTHLGLMRDEQTLSLHPDMILEALRPWKQELFQFRSPFQHPALINQAWIGFYCVCIPKAVWQNLPPPDEKLDSAGSDVDYCLEAASRGIPSYIHLSAFAFHFGSRTLSITAPPAIRDEAMRYLAEKRGLGNVSIRQ